MNHQTHYRIGLILCASLFANGCGQPNRASITGTVSLDGQPVEAGRITFVPIEGTQGPPASSPIEKGAFSIAPMRGLISGVYRVEIRSQRKTGRKIYPGTPAPEGTLVDEMTEAVPQRYNKRSTLRQELKAGENTCVFSPSSKEE